MRTITCFAFLTLALAACVDDPDQPPPASPPGTATALFGDDVDPYGVFEVGKTWPRDNLSVCWMASALDPALGVNAPILRQEGELLVMHEWNRVGRIRLTPSPWPSCADRPSDIRIGSETAPDLGGTSAIGTDALLRRPADATMTLNFNPRLGGSCPPSSAAACARARAATTLEIFQHVILHEFGHALGLRHEAVHEQSTCPAGGELVDDTAHGLDGQSVFAFDTVSVMNDCSLSLVLSTGDIRALHTLYPGVVGLYDNAELNSGTNGQAQPTWVGPGHYTAADVPRLGTLGSIVVPPGFRVRICSGTLCTRATTNRQLRAAWNHAIDDLEIEPTVLGADLPGYQGTTQEFDQTIDANLFTVLGDNRMSSVLPPSTRSARVCSDPGGAGACVFVVGGAIPTGFTLASGVDNQVSSIVVTKQIVTYSGRFTGTSKALGPGVFRASVDGAWVGQVKSFASFGLDVRVCTAEGTPGPFNAGGAGTCRTFSQSTDMTVIGPSPVAFIQVTVPPVAAP